MKLRKRAHLVFPLLLLFLSTACGSDGGGEPTTQQPDPSPVLEDIVSSERCDESREDCGDDIIESIDEGTPQVPDTTPEPEPDVFIPGPEPEQEGHINPNCSTTNLSSLIEIEDADDDSFYKVAIHGVPGELDACSLGCTLNKDCTEGSCSDACCDLCWRTLDIEEIGEEESLRLTPEIRTTLNNIENWKCGPQSCTEEPTCTPLDLSARYIVWGQAVIPKGAQENTLWVDDYCLETTSESVPGIYEGIFTYDLLTVDENGRYEGKKGEQEIRVRIDLDGEILSADVEELSGRGDVYLKGSINAGVTLNPDQGTATLSLTWCLSDAEECGETKVTLHSNRNNLIGDLNAVGYETSLGELKNLTLSVDRIFTKP